MNTIINVLTKNIMLDSIAITKVSLHNGSPGNNGIDNEITSANYSRQTCDMAASVGGVRLLNTDANFQMTNADAVSYVGYWDGATFKLAQEIDPVTFTADGLFILKSGATRITI